MNGKKVDRPSYAVKVGDTITLRDRIHKLARENMESMAGHIVPGWMEVNPSELSVEDHRHADAPIRSRST